MEENYQKKQKKDLEGADQEDTPADIKNEMRNDDFSWNNRGAQATGTENAQTPEDSSSDGYTGIFSQHMKRISARQQVQRRNGASVIRSREFIRLDDIKISGLLFARKRFKHNSGRGLKSNSSTRTIREKVALSTTNGHRSKADGRSAVASSVFPIAADKILTVTKDALSDDKPPEMASNKIIKDTPLSSEEIVNNLQGDDSVFFSSCGSSFLDTSQPAKGSREGASEYVNFQNLELKSGPPHKNVFMESSPVTILKKARPTIPYSSEEAEESYKRNIFPNLGKKFTHYCTGKALEQLKDQILYLNRNIEIPNRYPKGAFKNIFGSTGLDIPFKCWLRKKFIFILMENDKYLTYSDAHSVYDALKKLLKQKDILFFYHNEYKREKL